MNPIRERVLDDKKGFITKGEKVKLTLAEQVSVLSTRLDRANKKIKDIDKVWEERRSVDLVKLTDKVMAMSRELNTLRRDNDKLSIANKKMEETVEPTRKKK